MACCELANKLRAGETDTNGTTTLPRHPPMPIHQDSQEILDREFLPMRAKVLQLAADLDRIQRAAGDVSSDSRWKQIRQAIEEILRPHDNRAEQVQQIFSQPYDGQWQTNFGLQGNKD